jgi:hypothetical protein
MEGRDPEGAAHLLFLVGAAIMALVALYGLWKPASVFGNLQVERPSDAHPLDDIKRLVRHWPIYPALLIWFLWNFAPGSGTPLQYYLQDTLHAKDAQWSDAVRNSQKQKRRSKQQTRNLQAHFRREPRLRPPEVK